MEIMLQIEKLSYGTPTGRPLVKDVSFNVSNGDIAVIKGPNGIGKSTFLKIVSGFHKQLNGRIKNFSGPEKMVFFPQISGGEFHIDLTILDVLKISLGRRFDTAMILDFGLLNKGHFSRSWNTASGGEKQRTLLTRVFLQDSNVLVLDEPMNHLDKETRLQVKKKILDYVNNTGQQKVRRAVILVTHESFESTDLKRGNLINVDLGQFKYRRRSQVTSKIATELT
ncbi:MAG: ATP-binding cassette domain-containing protein [Proteobacteria bacterium]|nr:ATP-binding cassette domain-containing protein [Pseudomonadota bacterium]